MFRHIRYKLIAALAVPLLILVAVAGWEVSSTRDQMNSVDQEASLAKVSVGPGGAIQALQNERADAVLSVLAAAHNLPGSLQGLSPASAGLHLTPAGARVQSFDAMEAFDTTINGSSAQAKQAFQNALSSLPLLNGARQEWETAGTSTTANYQTLAIGIYHKYTVVIDQFINAIAQVQFQVTDPTLRTGVEALVVSLEKTESDWQVTMDLFQTAWAPKAAQAAALYRAAQDYGGEQANVMSLDALASGPYRGAVDTLLASKLNEALGADLGAMEEGRLASSLLPLVEGFGQGASQAGLGTFAQQGNAEIATVVYVRATQLHNKALYQMFEFGAAGAAGVIIGLLLVALVGRSVSRPLVDLAKQAERLATTTLPATVNTILEAGAAGDQPVSVPRVKVSSRDEVAGVARALDALNRTAVELATGQAALRRNLSEAFVNLGRRNQNLVTRQLEYISEIELKEADPASLEELFRLDHLATRMRRNAESLLILAGSGPARQWSAAAAAMDVARAASAEVEDYKRLRLHHFDPAMVSGSATTDLVHILAELTENALTFSPPGSPVDVYGRYLEGGYVIVIVDSGIGMTAEDLEIANRRLGGEGSEAEVPGRYLGHFVAGRLAARHRIAVSLQASHSGGLVARVKVPPELIEEAVPDLSAIAEVPPKPVMPDRAPSPSPRPIARPNGQGVPVPVHPAPSEPLQDHHEPGPVHGQSLQQEGPLVRPAVTAPADEPSTISGPSTTQPGPGDAAVPLITAHATGGTAPDHDNRGDRAGGNGGGAAGHLAEWLTRAGFQLPGAQDGTAAPGTSLSASPHASIPESALEPTSPLSLHVELGDAPPVAASREPATGGHGWDPIATAAQDGPAPGTPVEEPTESAPRIPDLGLLSALAATDHMGTLAQPFPFVGKTSTTAAPEALSLGAGPLPVSSDAAGPGSAAIWNALPAPWDTLPAPTVGPAAQARSTADGLRKLTRRVPGASLPQEDDSLRRATPTSTISNPLGLTGALSQYLSATANDARPEKEHNT